MNIERSTWLLLEKSDETRVSAGLDGYADVTGRSYRYDSTVPNHADLAVGDRLVIRLEDKIAGVGVIESIDIGHKQKVNRRCPFCNKTDIRERNNKVPKFRCGKCKEEFGEAKESIREVKTYVAEISKFSHFKGTGPRVQEIKDLGLRKDGTSSTDFQHSMMRLDSKRLDKILDHWPLQPTAQTNLEFINRNLGSLASQQEKLGEYDPNDGKDAREKVLKEINRRRGQPKFRRDLLHAYGGKCAISGMNCPQALEAAHILPYRGEHTNHVKNGLLLRSDIHTLFDLGLIGIEPETNRVFVASSLMNTGYSEWHGTLLSLPSDVASHPDPASLGRHFSLSGFDTAS